MIDWLAASPVSRGWPGTAPGGTAGAPVTPGADMAACRPMAGAEAPDGVPDEQPASRKQAQVPSAAMAPAAARRRAAREAVGLGRSAVMPIGRCPAGERFRAPGHELASGHCPATARLAVTSLADAGSPSRARSARVDG
jgi:hypothetical protein